MTGQGQNGNEGNVLFLLFLTDGPKGRAKEAAIFGLSGSLLALVIALVVLTLLNRRRVYRLKHVRRLMNLPTRSPSTNFQVSY